MAFFRAQLSRCLGRGAVRGADVHLGDCSTSSAGSILLGKLWHLVPISGYDGGLDAIKFLVLPVLIGVIERHRHRGALVPHHLPGGDRQGLRAHRARQGPDRSARAVPPRAANALIPILTGVVVVILPLLFMGSLLPESFFGIPGLGSYTIDAIQAPGFRRRARDGVSRLGALHHRADPDRHRPIRWSTRGCG